MRSSRLFLQCNARKVLQYRVRNDGENFRHCLQVSTCRLQGTRRLGDSVQIIFQPEIIRPGMEWHGVTLFHAATPHSSAAVTHGLAPLSCSAANNHCCMTMWPSGFKSRKASPSQRRMGVHNGCPRLEVFVSLENLHQDGCLWAERRGCVHVASV